jgi:hypothetical protein
MKNILELVSVLAVGVSLWIGILYVGLYGIVNH